MCNKLIKNTKNWLFISCLVVFSFISPAIYATTSSITGNFNAGTLPAGDYLWFSLVTNPTSSLSAPVNIYAVNGTINFTANSIAYSIAIPDAQVAFQTPGTTPSTTYTSQWSTTAPSNQSGNIFLSGVSFAIPNGGLPGGIKDVTVTENFLTDSGTPVTLNWQWAAALYNASMGTNYNTFGVSPVDSSFKAGTPVNQLADFLGGAGTGGGGSNYTGSLSATASVQPSVAAPEPSTYLILSFSLMIALVLFQRKRQKDLAVLKTHLTHQ